MIPLTLFAILILLLKYEPMLDWSDEGSLLLWYTKNKTRHFIILRP